MALAFAAGFLSFVSPCCLPLVPGYLATISGTVPGATGGRAGWRAVLPPAVLFVATFSAIFIALGLTATAFGSALGRHLDTLTTVSGVVIIVLGAVLAASVLVTRLNVGWRPRGLIARAGRGSPLVAGAAFAVAWTPCVGPTLGAILSLAAVSDGAVTGGVLLAVYSAGLGVRFLLSAVAFDAAGRGLSIFRRHRWAVQVGGGALLMGMGALVLTGELMQLNIEAQRMLDGFGLDALSGLWPSLWWRACARTGHRRPRRNSTSSSARSWRSCGRASARRSGRSTTR